jgi:crotonobetaine/carnitine-CoA ligase
MTVREFWEWRVDRTPDAPFLVAGEDAWTYAEFDRWVNRLANGLRDEGVGAGTRVALLLPSSADLLRIQWALQKVGAVWVPLIPSSTYAEISYVIDHAEVDALVTDSAGWATLQSGERLVQGVRTFVVDAGVEGADDLRTVESTDEAHPPPEGTTPMDLMAIMYTSGSTGRPKGVLQPNVGFRTVGHAVADRLNTDSADRWYCVMPLFHSGATHLIVGPAIAAGASVVLRPRFSRSEFWQDVRRHAATVSLLMPAMLSMLLTDPPRSDDRDNPLRIVFSHIRHPAFVERFDVDVCPGWGLTETLGVGALTPARFRHHRPHLIGLPSPADAEIRVLSETGDLLPPGERGELCVKHPHMFQGYYRDPENTARTLRNGWLHTGDVGSVDKEGFVYFHGRIKNVIKRAGENIAGEELEFTIMEHPAIEECVVCGVSDPIRTEEVYATVLVREGSSITEHEVVEWCADRLAHWKIPRYIRLVHRQLPKLPNGKTDRLGVNAQAELGHAWDGDEYLSRRPSRSPAAPESGSNGS